MKIWKTASRDDPSAPARLAKACDLPLPVATVLVNRGMSNPEDVDGFLHPRLSSLKDPFDLPAFSGRTPIQFLGAVIQPQYFWVGGFLIVTVILLTLFFEKTIIGKAMSACADNPDAASLVGINVRWMILLSFSLSAAIGPVAGITVTPISLMEYDRGAMLAIKGFGAVILGGLGSFPGAILGGLILGTIESFGAGLVSSGYKDAFALIVLLAVLFFRPRGLLGSVEISKIKRF